MSTNIKTTESTKRNHLSTGLNNVKYININIHRNRQYNQYSYE